MRPRPPDAAPGRFIRFAPRDDGDARLEGTAEAGRTNDVARFHRLADGH